MRALTNQRSRAGPNLLYEYFWSSPRTMIGQLLDPHSSALKLHTERQANYPTRSATNVRLSKFATKATLTRQFHVFHSKAKVLYSEMATNVVTLTLCELICIGTLVNSRTKSLFTLNVQHLNTANVYFPSFAGFFLVIERPRASAAIGTFSHSFFGGVGVAGVSGTGSCCTARSVSVTR